ncbi:MAG: tyrosine-type recombinase/integrase [Thermoplasmatales archaeon]|nr:MAG: tyrosine-type recombinase/integrase [Thermoplasmatales archaeon]
MSNLDEQINLLFFDTKPNTLKTIRTGIKKFFSVINKNPETYFDNKKDEDFENDLKLFYSKIQSNAPTTISQYISAVKSYLGENKIYLHEQGFWKKFRRKLPKNKPILLDRIPTMDEIRKILLRCDPLERTIILCLLSSGMRIDELLKIEEKHVNFESKPTEIIIPHTIAKNKQQRIVFISEEATESLKDWLKHRNEFIEKTYKKVNFPNVKRTPKDSTKIFPIDYSTFKKRYHNILNELKEQFIEKCPNTGYYKLHIHTFRKYFDTHMKTIIPEPIVRALTGHEGYLSNNYEKYTDEEKKKYYLKAEHIITTSGNISTIEEKYKQEIEQIKIDQDKIIHLLNVYRKGYMEVQREKPSDKQEDLRNDISIICEPSDLPKKAIHPYEKLEKKEKST